MSSLPPDLAGVPRVSKHGFSSGTMTDRPPKSWCAEARPRPSDGGGEEQWRGELIEFPRVHVGYAWPPSSKFLPTRRPLRKDVMS